MLNFYKIKLKRTVIHKIGNKSLDEGVVLSENVFNGNDNQQLNQILLNYFLTPFKDPVYYSFTHPSKLELNDVYTIISETFDAPKKFPKASRDLAKILYDCSSHPKIKPGELYIAYFSDCVVNDEVTDAIGIFKSETKQTFLQVEHKKNEFNIDHFTGINTQKLEKGALIINSDQTKGYLVTIIDNLNAGEAQYWKHDFLKLLPADDGYHATKNFLSVAKEFVAQLPEEQDISKADQIDLLNRSIEYFKDNENFNKKEFERKVFQDKDLINSFRKFDSTFREENFMRVPDDFDISSQAVRRQTKVFKSVLKLDKNFHIYIHGDRELIEKGVDKNGRKFYKIYYREES